LWFWLRVFWLWDVLRQGLSWVNTPVYDSNTMQGLQLGCKGAVKLEYAQVESGFYVLARHVELSDFQPNVNTIDSHLIIIRVKTALSRCIYGTFFTWIICKWGGQRR
tara:strand:+ start:1319 stop:1639 length:321 start_codon:yes stop_codon:yes gene_type:complete